jgi:ribosomal protein S27AE
VHYEVCETHENLYLEIDITGEVEITTYLPKVEDVCDHFINKADFVEVKHGEWVRQKGRPEAICSECGREVVYQIIDNKWRFENFCPHCGADTRKEGADNG